MDITMDNAQQTVDTAKHKVADAVEAARDGVQVAKHSTLHTIANGGAMLAKAVSVATVLATALRKFDRDDGLAWFGLARRRSPLATVATFGAGAAFGASVALLLAPTSGKDLRRNLLERLTSMKTEEAALNNSAQPEAKASSMVASTTKGRGSDATPSPAVRVAGNGDGAKSS